MQAWCKDATLPTLFFFQKQQYSPKKPVTLLHQALPKCILNSSSPGPEITYHVQWFRDAGSEPPCEMSLLKLGYLREDISSPRFSAALSIPDFTPKEAF